MATTKIDQWARELQSGTINIADFGRIGKFKFAEVLAELTAIFPHKFLERTTQNSYEVGLALVHGQTSRAGQKGVIHSYRQCILLKSEVGVLTGLTLLNKLRFRPSSTENNSFEFFSGAGISAFHSPDGWIIKVLEEKTVSLTTKLLTQRGWLVGKAA